MKRKMIQDKRTSIGLVLDGEKLRQLDIRNSKTDGT